MLIIILYALDFNYELISEYMYVVSIVLNIIIYIGFFFPNKTAQLKVRADL